MSTTLSGNRLERIKVTGKGLSIEAREACVGAKLDLAIDKVTEMSLTFVDSHTMSLYRSGVLGKGASVAYGDWRLRVAETGVGGGALGPEVSVRAPSRFVTDLKNQKGGKSWGTQDLSGWVKQIAKSVGMKPVVQPGLGRRTIIRQKAEDGGDAESTWDVLTTLARETGVWLFEYGSTLVFAKPTWLSRSSWASRRWPITWDSWGDMTPGLTAMPKHTVSDDTETPERLSLSLASADADKARPGDTVALSGRNAGPMKGTWVVTGVSFPLTVADVVTLECQRPVDPAPEPPETDKARTTSKKASSSGSSGSSGGGAYDAALGAKVDRWAASVNGRSLDFDGFAGAQCTDLAQYYNRDIVGGPFISGNGAKDFWNASAINANYTKYHVGGATGERAGKGDLAIWDGSWGGGWGHIAVVIEDKGSSVLCMSQNPGPTRRVLLSKRGLIGYARPKKWK